jgi:hypothetical protein
MASEFLSSFSQGLDQVARSSLQEAQEIVQQKEALEAANLLNDFRMEREADLLESEQNYNNSGDFAERQKEKFEAAIGEKLSTITNDRVRRQFEKQVENYQGNYNTHTLKFQVEAEREYQQTLLAENRSFLIGKLAGNPTEENYIDGLAQIQETYKNFPDSNRKAYLNDGVSKYNSAYVDIIASSLDRQFAEGKIATPEQYKTLMETQVLSKIKNTDMYFSAEARENLFLKYNDRSASISKELRKANYNALLGNGSSYLDLYASGRTTKDPLFEQQLLDANIVTQDDLEVADISSNISSSIVAGLPGQADRQVAQLAQELNQARSKDDYKKVEAIQRKMDAATGAIAKKRSEMVKNLPDALAMNAEIQNYEDAGNLEGHANALWRMGTGVVPEAEFKLLGSAKASQYVQALNSANPNLIQEAIGSIKRDYNFHITGSPNGKMAYEYVRDQILSTSGLNSKAAMLFEYADSPVHGALISNALSAELGTAVTTADELSKKNLNAEINSGLQKYRDALDTTSDVVYDDTNIIIRHEKGIADLAKGLVQIGHSSPADAVKDAIDMTIGKKFNVVTNTKGQANLVPTNIQVSDKYNAFLKETQAQKSFIRDKINQPEIQELLPDAGEIFNTSFGTAMGVEKRNIINTGVFVPVEGGSKLRLYATHQVDGLTGNMPVMLRNGEYIDIDAGEFETGRLDKHLGGYLLKQRSPMLYRNLDPFIGFGRGEPPEMGRETTFGGVISGAGYR